jgi:ferric-dicitrate binding protein FerR (iron transport regulator)
MRHVDPDRLVLLALGEVAADLAESGHVAHCVACRHDLDTTREVAEAGRRTQDLVDLPPPPARVWQRIAAATGVADRPEPVPAVTRPARPPRRSRLRVLALVAATAAAAVAVTLALPRPPPTWPPSRPRRPARAASPGCSAATGASACTCT